MQVIEMFIKDRKYQIEWAISEHFDELKGKKYMFNEVAADQIVKLNNLSEVAKILLSAVAGAAIQYLMDNALDVASIFDDGYFIVK